MKKIIAILLACLFALALAACGDGPSNPGNTTTRPAVTGSVEGIYFAPKGVRIEIDALPEPVLAALGEPLHELPSKSCALQAQDIIYNYPGFDLTVTYPEQGEDYISNIDLPDDTYTIPGGITIGSAAEAVFAAYGTHYREDNGHYYFTKDMSVLHFIITNDLVTGITYQYDWDNA
jgi:hypothetical protein